MRDVYTVNFAVLSYAVTRLEIDSMLMDKLPDVLDDEQKYNKVSSLLRNLRDAGMIINTSTARKTPTYEMRTDTDYK
jgi:hypothetical protein